MTNCPKGYYWNGEKCQKSITIKRNKGIYGKGFLSEPKSEQHAKIRKEDKIEGNALVDKQMAALNAFSRNTYNKKITQENLKYAEMQPKRDISKSLEKHNVYNVQDPRCPNGQIWVHGYTDRYGKVVKSHCRKEKKRK